MKQKTLSNASRKLKIVVPGDSPPQIQGSPHLERLKPYGDVVLYTDRPETSEAQIRRAEDADILINSRGLVKWARGDPMSTPQAQIDFALLYRHRYDWT